MAAQMSSRSGQVTIQEEETPEAKEQQGDKPSSPAVTIKLRKPKPKLTKKVSFTEDTVDNEELGKKKSKCCCIYEKPKQFAESSDSESEKECQHCSGHVEAKHKTRRSPSPPPPPRSQDDDDEEDDPAQDGNQGNTASAEG